MNFRILDLKQGKFLLSKLLLVILMLSSGTLAAQQIKFSDATVQFKLPGYTRNNISCYGHGSSMADINNDSIPDLYIANAIRYANNQVPETLYRSEPTGFVECDGALKVSDEYGWTGSHGICFFDYNNDGLYDIYNATTDDLNRLYKNIGTPTAPMFSCVNNSQPNAVNLPKIEFHMPDFDPNKTYGYGTRGVVAFDANNDGWMDLLAVNWGPAEQRKCDVCYIKTPAQPNEFYLSNGNGTFTWDENNAYGLNGTVRVNGEWVNPSYVGTQGVTAVDVNNDGWMDIFICHRNLSMTSDSTIGYNFPEYQAPNNLFMNDGTGRFKDELAKRHLQTLKDGKDPNDCNGATFADFDNDGDLDAFVIPKDGQSFSSVQAYKNLLNETGNFDFDNVTKEITTDGAGIKQAGFSLHFLDADNDGDLDIIAPISKSTVDFYLNVGNGKYTRQSNTGLGITVYDPRGGSVGDVNGDGLLDIYWVDKNKTTNFDKPEKLDPAISNRLFINKTVTNNKWLRVTGRGPKGDMGAFGTKIWVFDQGFMDDMNHLVGYREVQNTYGYLCQDDPTQHFGLAQREAVDVKITLLGGTTFKIQNVLANQTLFFNMPSTLVLNDGDGQQGEAGQPVPKPLSVLVTFTDVLGKTQPAAGVPVNFSVLSGNGSIAQVQPVYTDMQGIARVNFTLGATAGEQKVVATSSLLTGSSVTFTLQATQSGPTKIALISSAAVTGIAGQVLADSVKVRVTQASGDGQPNHPVRFAIVAGTGSLQPGNTSQVDAVTNAAGYAAVAWKLGTLVTEPQELRITSEFKSTPLAGSPLTVRATVAPGPVARLEIIDGDNQTGTVGMLLPVPLQAQVKDSYGNPVYQAKIKYKIVAGSGKIADQDSVLVSTEPNGQASATWRLGQQVEAQRTLVYAQDNTAVRVEFNATAKPGAAATLIWTGGSTFQGTVNKNLPDSLVAKVVDSFGNVVPGVPVSFIVESAEGLANGQRLAQVLTNSTGLAKCAWTLGKTAGVNNNILRVEANGLSGSPVRLTASGLADDPARLVLRSGNNQSGQPGTVLSSPLVVQVLDQYGNSSAGRTVIFTVQQGDAKLESAQSVTKITDADGQAQAFLQLGNIVGPIQVAATSSFNSATLIGSPVIFSANFIALKLVKVAGDNQVGKVAKALNTMIEVQLIDSSQKPVANAMLSVKSHNPRGMTEKTMTGMTNNSGLAKFNWELGTLAGAWELSVAYQKMDSVLFKAQAEPDAPAQIQKLAGDRQFGKPAAMLESPLTVQVSDQFANPITGAQVSFSVTSGNGSILPPSQVATDGTGQASARWQLGATGTQFARAAVVGLALGTDFEAFFSQNNLPVISCVSDTTIQEMQKLVFPVRTFDPDGESVTLSVMSMPSGASFDAIQNIFTWTPNYEQAGSHQAIFKATDTRDGYSVKITNILVTNSNRAPWIKYFEPNQDTVKAIYGTTLAFRIEAQDDDQENLRYEWWLGELDLKHTQANLQLLVSKNYPQEFVVKVKVYDTAAQVEHSWNVKIEQQTAIEDENQNLPLAFDLEQNYPNPFNPTTTIKIKVAATEHVKITMFNASGQMIRVLADRIYSPGSYALIWDAKDDQGNVLSSGVYYCEMVTREFKKGIKLLLLK